MSDPFSKLPSAAGGGSSGAPASDPFSKLPSAAGGQPLQGQTGRAQGFGGAGQNAPQAKPQPTAPPQPRPDYSPQEIKVIGPPTLPGMTRHQFKPQDPLQPLQPLKMMEDWIGPAPQGGYAPGRKPQEYGFNAMEDVKDTIGMAQGMASIPFVRGMEETMAHAKAMQRLTGQVSQMAQDPQLIMPALQDYAKDAPIIGPDKGLIRYQTDPQEFGAVMKEGLITYPYNQYIKPMWDEKARHGAKDYGDYLRREFLKRPGITALDSLIAVGPIKAVGKQLNKYRKQITPPMPPKAAPPGIDGGPMGPPTPHEKWYNETLKPSVRKVFGANSADAKAMLDRMLVRDAERAQSIMSAANELRKAEKRLRNVLSRKYKLRVKEVDRLIEQMTAIGEKTDAALVNKWGNEPVVKAFLDVHRKYNQIFEETLGLTENPDNWDAARLQEHPPGSPAHSEAQRIADIHTRAKYGPQMLAAEGRAGRQWKARDLNPDEFKVGSPEWQQANEHMLTLREMRRAAEKHGEKPVFFPLASREAAARELTAGYSDAPMGGVKGGQQVQHAGNVGASPSALLQDSLLGDFFKQPERDLPGWGRGRRAAHTETRDIGGEMTDSLRQSQHEMGPTNLTLLQEVRRVKVKGLYGLMRDVVEKHASGAVDARGNIKPGHVAIDLEERLGDTFKQAGMGKEEVKHFFDEVKKTTVVVPEAIGAMLNDILDAPGAKPGSVMDKLDKGYQTVKGLKNWWQFSTNPVYEIKNALQNIPLMLNKIKADNAIDLLLANMLADHPLVKEMLPDAILGMDRQITPSLLKKDVDLNRLAGPLKTGIELERLERITDALDELGMAIDRPFAQKRDWGDRMQLGQRRRIALATLIELFDDTPMKAKLNMLLKQKALSTHRNIKRMMTELKPYSSSLEGLKAIEEELYSFGNYSIQASESVIGKGLGYVYQTPNFIRQAGRMFAQLPFKHPLRTAFGSSVSRADSRQAFEGIDPEEARRKRQWGRRPLRRAGRLMRNEDGTVAYGGGIDMQTVTAFMQSVSGLLAMVGLLPEQEGSIDEPSALAAPLELGAKASAQYGFADPSTKKPYLDEHPEVYEGKRHRLYHTGTKEEVTEAEKGKYRRPDMVTSTMTTIAPKVSGIYRTLKTNKSGKLGKPSPFGSGITSPVIEQSFMGERKRTTWAQLMAKVLDLHLE